MIEVILNDRLGKKIRVKCNEDDTIGDLKKLIALQIGTRPEKLRIQKWYTIYKDHITLEDYEIHDGMGLELYVCTLHNMIDVLRIAQILVSNEARLKFGFHVTFVSLYIFLLTHFLTKVLQLKLSSRILVSVQYCYSYGPEAIKVTSQNAVTYLR